MAVKGTGAGGCTAGRDLLLSGVWAAGYNAEETMYVVYTSGLGSRCEEVCWFGGRGWALLGKEFGFEEQAGRSYWIRLGCGDDGGPFVVGSC